MPESVQGINYVGTLPANKARAYDSFKNPSSMSMPDGKFTFDMIESWAGEGSNRAALVIQWNTGKDKVALVFGYKWNGQATGADMIKAVAKANPRLYTLMQYTNVSSATDPNGGYTINGFGWDADNDGDIRLIDTGKGNAEYTSPDGFFEHPRGYVPGQGGSSDYDYDNWKAADTDDWWQAGWYKGYWSYWVKSSNTGTFSYSGVGASGRLLSDGCWDGWNYSVDMMSQPWMDFEPAPSPIPDGAVTEFKVNGIYYKLKNYQSHTVEVSYPVEIQGETLTSYNGAVVIPTSFEAMDGDTRNIYTVTGIAPKAFEGSAVTTVELPQSVTTIGKRAFMNSTLSRINITETISAIADSAFMGCSALGNITLPPSITTVGPGTFAGTACTELSIPSTVSSIGYGAYAGCTSLTEIVIPVSIKSLGEYCFAGCDALKSVKATDTYPIDITDNCFSDVAYNSAMLYVPTGFGKAYGEAEGWKNFTHVGEFNIDIIAGAKFSLDGITYQIVNDTDNLLSAKVTYCRTEGAPTIASIRTANEKGYTGHLNIPASIRYQGQDLKITAVNDSAFFGSKKLKSVILPDGITAVPGFAFYQCDSLISVTVPSSVTAFEANSFYYCKSLESVNIPAGLTSLGNRTFYGCSALPAISIPVGVTTIPQYCFYQCESIKSVEIGDQVTDIEMYAFSYCKGLESVKLPATLTSIKQGVFQHCEALTAINFPESLTSIANYGFSYCKSLKTDIPQHVTSFGQEAFSYCTALEDVTIPSSVTSVPNSFLRGCSALRKVTLGKNISSLGTYAFAGCTSLTEIVIPSKVTAISNYLFQNCSKLTTVAMTDNIKTIGNYAFQNCSNLQIYIPSSVTSIGTYAFSGMKLNSIELPEGLKTIGNYAFQNNNTLTEIVIPSTVTSLSSSYIFYGCSNATVYILNPKPINAGTTTFKLTSSNYIPVIVPVGSKSDFMAAANWKNITTLTEPAVTDIDFSSQKVITDNNSLTATLSITPELIFGNTTLPDRFVDVCRTRAAACGTMKVEYGIADGSMMAVNAIADDSAFHIT
ncbi:MAG: leucine-rich repeat domain-containing protein, partial [Muribaculaceae bacterium]|nr:leucine-rich repeat domain-containing protein [Muribaculaceae bacterium]